MAEQQSCERRAAHNQALFRSVNDRIQALNQAWDLIVPYASWTCECDRLDCIEPVELTLAEYERVRLQPDRFLVAPDESHVDAAVERVVSGRTGIGSLRRSGRPPYGHANSTAAPEFPAASTGEDEAMAGEAEAFRVLTLLIAVCEEAIPRLDALDPPTDAPVADIAQQLRDLSALELQSGRFVPPDP